MVGEGVDGRLTGVNDLGFYCELELICDTTRCVVSLIVLNRRSIEVRAPKSVMGESYLVQI